MADGKLKEIKITTERVRSLGEALLRSNSSELEGDMEYGIGVDGSEADRARHLTDEEFVAQVRKDCDLSSRARIEAHLCVCSECAQEVRRLQDLSGVWGDKGVMADLQNRARRALGLAAQPRANTVFTTRRSISLAPLLRPAGAYGETGHGEGSTIEFPVVEHGEIVHGLKGLLMRTDRDLYVQVAANDPQSSRAFGDRKAMISISDTALEQPILQRKIDVGVTVLLGTDVRLSRNSQLAVEMLPEWES